MVGDGPDALVILTNWRVPGGGAGAARPSTPSTFAQAGLVQSLGEKTHALVLDMDLGEEVEIKNIELECLSNEVLVGLLGITVM